MQDCSFILSSKIPPQYAFSMHQLLLRASKQVFFSCVGINKSHWVPNEGCMADDSTFRHFSWSLCVRVCVVVGNGFPSIYEVEVHVNENLKYLITGVIKITKK